MSVATFRSSRTGSASLRAVMVAAAFLFAGNAHAVDYLNVKITGIGLVSGEDYIRFTIDQDPNVILVTTDFSGEQLKRLVALVTAAYTAESPIALVRSDESTSSSQRHYAEVTILSIGTYTFDQ